MSRRRLPKTLSGRWVALSTASTKNLLLAPASRFLTASTQARLDAIITVLRTAINARASALSNQTACTAEVYRAKAKSRAIIGHYYQVFDFAVLRDIYTKSNRAYYHRDIDKGPLPRMKTEAEIILQGVRIAMGEAALVAGGGVPMTNPSAAEVAAVHAAFDTLNSTQSTLKDIYDNAQEAVNNLLPEADAVIKKLWDEVETYYNEETPPSLRRKAREWGVFYESPVYHTIEVNIVEQGTDTPLEGARAEIKETGLLRTTAVNGKLTLVTNASDVVTIHCSKAAYAAKETIVEFITGQTEYSIGVELDHV